MTEIEKRNSSRRMEAWLIGQQSSRQRCTDLRRRQAAEGNAGGAREKDRYDIPHC